MISIAVVIPLTHNQLKNTNMKPCLYCGQTATQKNQNGFCIKYGCEERQAKEMRYRYLHRYDHLKPFQKKEETFEDILQECHRILDNMSYKLSTN